MPARRPRTPSYRLHKPTGQAVVTLSGKDFYLGRHGTAASRAEYDRLVAEWLAAGRTLPAAPSRAAASDLTVAELIVGYLRFAEGYYRTGRDTTSEVENIRLAMKPLRRLYGHAPASSFGPKSLKATREAMVAAGLCRREVNKRVRHVVRAFKWATSEELVPPDVYHGLRTVTGLRLGRTSARESAPVRPVADADVEAIRSYVAPQIWAMIELQRLTGARSGEICLMRSGDIDMSKPVWAFRPQRYKGQHFGKRRVIYLGPRARRVVEPWLLPDPSAFIFQPQAVVEAYFAERRRARRTPLTPSQRARQRVAHRRRPPGEHYTSESYARVIAKACRRAGVPHWHPHQLRHACATAVRARFGLEAGQLILGHARADVTQIYAARDEARAITIAAECC
jgi:integrase